MVIFILGFREGYLQNKTGRKGLNITICGTQNRVGDRHTFRLDLLELGFLSTSQARGRVKPKEEE